MKNTSITESLKEALADTYSLYLKTQNFHWNVTGPNFNALHLLFEGQYTDLAMAVDSIAERIRALGEKAPGTWKAYEQLSTIQDGDENADASTMVQQLADDQDLILTTLQQVLAAAQEKGDEVTVGLAVERMTVHEKAAWMLRSSL